MFPSLPVAGETFSPFAMEFHDLPLDIYTLICSFLTGLDILALGQVCIFEDLPSEFHGILTTNMTDMHHIARFHTGALRLDKCPGTSHD